MLFGLEGGFVLVELALQVGRHLLLLVELGFGAVFRRLALQQRNAPFGFTGFTLDLGQGALTLAFDVVDAGVGVEQGLVAPRLLAPQFIFLALFLVFDVARGLLFRRQRRLDLLDRGALPGEHPALAALALRQGPVRGDGLAVGVFARIDTGLGVQRRAGRGQSGQHEHADKRPLDQLNPRSFRKPACKPLPRRVIVATPGRPSHPDNPARR